MKQRVYLPVVMLFVFLGIHAQKLTVESMEAAAMDLSASTQPRNDRNGNPCGLVKVQLAAVGAQFEGNVLGDAEYKAGEYWVYMSQGSYMLKVKHPNFVPLDVNFRDYDIRGVQPKTTYVLTLLMPQAGPVNVDDGMRYLAMTVEPKDAIVMIDDKPQTVDNGNVKIRLPKGIHRYSVMAAGYASRQGEVTLSEGTERLQVRLQSVMAGVTIRCATAGADVFLNGEHVGKAPWQGELKAGNYEVEARLTGYRSNRQSISLAENEQRTIDIPALQAITGNLDVNYDPMDAEVWVDGKKLGLSPDIFRNILVGRHEVELRKSGYATKKEKVTISEGQTAQLAGQLEQSTSATATDVASGGSAVETFTVNDVSFRMVRVEGGTFQMGSNDSEANSDEKPVHLVSLSTFSIGETEVTQELWQAVMGKNPSKFKGAKRPVERVSWEDCQQFIRKLNELTGKSFRLPTEAEWEYAARGGSKGRGYKYAGSNDIVNVACYYGISGGTTHDVATKQANELGLYDMSGNVWEWCQDWFGNYTSDAQTNPTGPQSGSDRVGRGGSWLSFYARYCRSSIRYNYTPSSSYNDLGLRLAL